jgi:hypothetical protein
MGKKYNAREKRQRRKRYIKRKKEESKIKVSKKRSG